MFTSHNKDNREKDKKVSRSGLGRRDLMRLGAGAAVAGMLKAPAAFARQGQQLPPISPTSPLAPREHGREQHFPEIRESQEVITTVQPFYITKTRSGWVNDSGRAWGNGPMDESSRRIVDWVRGFSFKDLDAKTIETINYVQTDTVGMLYAGFESEPARINARLSQTMPGPCTVMGYGIKTTYEMAAFTNGAMIRNTDFNATPHNNEMFGGILAVGEALHSSGPDVMAAMAISYEVIDAIGNTGKGNYDPDGWDCPYHSVGVAMACGKLMGLNQDQLANALSLALVPHMPMYVCHIGIQSMWKGTHSAEQVRNGVWGAMLAREGMTGPHMPFEARDGLWVHIGPPTRDLKFPASPDGRLSIEVIPEGISALRPKETIKSSTRRLRRRSLSGPNPRRSKRLMRSSTISVGRKFAIRRSGTRGIVRRPTIALRTTSPGCCWTGKSISIPSRGTNTWIRRCEK